MAEIDPEQFASLEVLKEKLDAVLESNGRIEGRLEALQAALDEITEKP